MMMDIVDGVYDATSDWQGMVIMRGGAVTAGAFPVKPPKTWFANPDFKTVTPLTVQSDGRVFGHIATWDASHIGMAGQVRPPRSKSNYAFFATGVVECDDGSMVNTGQITLAGGHASLEASVAEAVAHYDDTNSAVMDVTVGEDAVGIWVAGSLRPDVDDSRIRSIRASSVSGDWRPINGSLELVAVCAVNVPGFPIPRARVASGQPVALVAAGTEQLVMAAMTANTAPVVTAGLETIDLRVRRIEDVILNRVRDRRTEIDGDVRMVKAGQLVEDRQKFERRQQAMTAAAIADGREAARVAEARARIGKEATDWWIDRMPIHLSLQACGAMVEAVAIRARVHGHDSIIATATSTWDAGTRRKAAKSGIALPDGSYPIRDRRDWDKAVQAIGRAKNRPKVAAHIRKRGRALGIAKEKIAAVTSKAA